jgi:cyclopropane fatty-acyl-phospholipid synthase-like methyltransferase
MSLTKPEFPRSNAYDPELALDGNMGPNPLWLTEWLLSGLELEPGMRVLDLGCGKAISSIFVAKEASVQVHAVDLWASVDNNWSRIIAASETHHVTPIHAEAHALPFAARYFDAVVSVDSYQYFGTDAMYLYYLTRFLRPGGQIGIVVPGLMQPLPDGQVPDHLTSPQSNGTAFWEDECVSIRTAESWRGVFAACSRVHQVRVDTLDDGWRHWRDWERIAEQSGKAPFPSVAEALDQDAGRYLGFVRIRARRNDAEGLNLYDPALAARVVGGE